MHRQLPLFVIKRDGKLSNWANPKQKVRSRTTTKVPRVSVAPFRDKAKELHAIGAITWTEIGRRLGWNSAGIGTRVRILLGMRSNTGNEQQRHTRVAIEDKQVNQATAVLLAKALGMDPVDYDSSD